MAVAIEARGSPSGTGSASSRPPTERCASRSSHAGRALTGQGAHAARRRRSGRSRTSPSTSREGEVLGVIGRNGAGKSTLLKVLTRITTPTAGRVEIRGRVGSLLEVGTGFHPELTGRENIYLNGAILGMKRREIQRSFDDIVEFSGVERFLDTPVKRYSSGMYVRLAFSVAAHLEPEILLVDEVLAVGDAEFQRRCLGRMEDFGASGRTVLFVSHNMQAVAQLCDRAILLEDGRIVAGRSERGRRRALPPDLRAPARAVRGTISTRARRRSRAAPLGADRRPDGRRSTTSTYASRRNRDRLPRAQRRAPRPSEDQARSPTGAIAFNAMDIDPRWHEPTPPGEYVATAWIPGNSSTRGSMSVDAASARSARPKLHHHVERPRGGLVPRPGPRRGRLRARAVHGTVARRGAAAARVDAEQR